MIFCSPARANDVDKERYDFKFFLQLYTTTLKQIMSSRATHAKPNSTLYNVHAYMYVREEIDKHKAKHGKAEAETETETEAETTTK